MKESTKNIDFYHSRISLKEGKIIVTKWPTGMHEEMVFYYFSRIVFIIIAFAFSFVVLPYYTYDDLELYSVVTLDKIDPVFYLQQRQGWVVICAIINSVEIFRMLQIPRIINIFFGWFVVKELNFTMKLIGLDDWMIRKSIRFIVFFPIFIIFTCSITKEIIFMWCVWSIINQMFKLIEYHHINIIKTIICSVLGMIIRFGVIESLVMVMITIYIWRSKGIRRFSGIAVMLIIVLIAVRMWSVVGGDVIFEQKSRIYLGSENEIIGTKSSTDIIMDIIIKLFGAGPRLHLQEGKILWISFLGYLSIFNIYIIYWTVVWLLNKGKNWKEWFMLGFLIAWMVFLSYTDSVIYRQILFLQPVLWILGCKGMYSIYDRNVPFRKISSILISSFLYGIMFIYVRIV